MKVGILGVGEVGGSVKKVVAKKHSVYGRDLAFDELKGKKIDVLHVCIPYSANFVRVVVASVKELKPKLVLIESSVVVGTTRKISQKTDCLMVHSFIRGIHPNLDKGIKIFTKLVGGVNKKSMLAADKYYRGLGIKTIPFVGPENSEAAKLWSTTYYSFCVIFQKELWQYCQKHGLDFKLVYDLANRTYNEGYQKLGKLDFTRMVLKHMPGPIGGHCLIPNCKLIEKESSNPITKFILKKNKEY